MATGPLQVHLGDVVRLRKPHPCGDFEWTVVRIGADIGLRCHGCDHKVLMPRRTLEKRLKAFVSRGPGYVEARPTADDRAADPAVAGEADRGVAVPVAASSPVGR
jgi:hypothetical protein